MFTVEMGRTLDGLHAALDENPDDWDTRRVIGDLYEEAGLVEEAQAWRWMTEEGKRPALWTARFRTSTWDWWSDKGEERAAGDENIRPCSILPKELLRIIPRSGSFAESEEGGNDLRPFGLRESRTRREAEEKLVAAWVKWRRGGE